MPNEVAALRGVRKSRINDARPVPRTMPPDMPPGLTTGGEAEWNRVIPDLIAMGTAKAVDQAALAAYCECVALFYWLSDLINKSGPLIFGEDGDARKNPLIAMRRDVSYEMRMWAREFGFTPSARQPMRVEHAHTVIPADRLLTG